MCLNLFIFCLYRYNNYIILIAAPKPKRQRPEKRKSADDLAEEVLVLEKRKLEVEIEKMNLEKEKLNSEKEKLNLEKEKLKLEIQALKRDASLQLSASPCF